MRRDAERRHEKTFRELRVSNDVLRPAHGHSGVGRAKRSLQAASAENAKARESVFRCLNHNWNINTSHR
jgi:hypothetical protein